MRNKKLQVYVVLEFDGEGEARVDKLFLDRESASVRIDRLLSQKADPTHSFHIIKRAVNGTEDHDGFVFKNFNEDK